MVYDKGKEYILFSLHKIGEYITTEEVCLYHSASYNFIYSTLHFCSQKKKVVAGTLVLAPWLASSLTYKKFLQKNLSRWQHRKQADCCSCCFRG